MFDSYNLINKPFILRQLFRTDCTPTAALEEPAATGNTQQQLAVAKKVSEVLLAEGQDFHDEIRICESFHTSVFLRGLAADGALLPALLLLLFSCCCSCCCWSCWWPGMQIL